MPQTYTVAQAAAAYTATHHTIAAMAISDTASDILASLSLLSSLVSAGKVGGVAISGSGVISSYQALELSALPSVSGGLVIEDSAANLLSSSRIAAIDLLGSAVVVTGSNRVSAAQAAKLAAYNNASLATGATLVVADSAANILLSANAAGIALATSVSLSVDSTVTAAQATALAAIPGFTKPANGVLHVVDTVTNLTNSAYAAGLAFANYTLLSTNSTVSAAQLTSLAATHGFGEVSGVSVTTEDDASDLVADVATIAKYSNNTVLSGTNNVSASDAIALLKFHNLTLAQGASLTVSDTAANYAALLAAEGATKPGFALPTGFTAIVSDALAAQAASFQSDPNVTGFTVEDTGADLTGSVLDQLQSDSKLTGITVTSGTVSILYGWYTQLSTVLHEITPGFTLKVLDAPISAGTSLQNDTLVSSFSIADVGSKTSNYYNIPQKVTQVASYVFVNYSAGDEPLYSSIIYDTLEVDNAPVSAVSTLQAISNTNIRVADTAENVTSDASTLFSQKDILSVTVSGGHVLDLSTITGMTTVTMGGNSAYASGSDGMAASSLSFIGTPDTVAMPSYGGTVNYDFSTGGVEELTNWAGGNIQLILKSGGQDPTGLELFDTTVNGHSAVAITTAATPSEGVILMGLPSNFKAADILAPNANTGSSIVVNFA